MVQLTDPQTGKMNRVVDALLSFTQPEAKHLVDHPGEKQDSTYNLNLWKQHYESILGSYSKRKNLSPLEKQSLRYIRHKARETSAKLNPTFLNRLSFFPPVNFLLNLIVRRLKVVKEHGEFFKIDTEEATRKYNLNNLQAKLQEAGFKHSLDEPIKKALEHDLEKFSIRTNAPGLPNTDYTLHFKKIPGTQAYAFDNYDAVQRMVDMVIAGPGIARPMHNYSPLQEQGFSAAEAAALANGRPVMKIMEGKEVWHSHDIKGFKATGFDLSAELSQFPIKELQNPNQGDVLTNALQGGRIREVHVAMPNGQEVLAKVKIAPDLSGLIFWDKTGQVLTVPKKAINVRPSQLKALATSLQRANKLATAMSNKRVFKRKIS